MMAQDKPPSQMVDDAGFVRSFARGLAVLKAFDSQNPCMTLSEVARKIDLPRATTGRFLETLVTLGYASFDGRDYRLRPRVLELGMAYFSSHSFLDIANPLLKEAAERAEEHCSMAVLDGAEIVYVARHTANRMMSFSISIGKRYPAVYTSLGRALLGTLPDAALDDIIRAADLQQITPQTIVDKVRLRSVIVQGRKDGYILAQSQLEVGILSIAVPIVDRSGVCIAAINIGVPASRHTPDSMRQDVLPILRSAADELEFALSKLL
jgi:IclR family pca regulon transcriptional regulator